MKSLKRTLSLVLALVMVLGLFGGISMTAAASDFTDDESIQYKEAVDVMTAIGAIAGYDEGGTFTFRPKEPISRAEAAKLVAYTVLGKDAADRLTGVTSSYSDVTVEGGYGWAIPSIEYLASEGVINGRDGKVFDPKGNITTYEVAKMLLCAIGYGAKDEYVGPGWDLAVAVDGVKYHVLDGRADNATKPDTAATREEVALCCFNAIQQTKARYISALDVYVAETVTLAGGATEKVSIMDLVYSTLDCTEAYNPNDETEVQYSNDAGEPSNLWKYKGHEIGEYPVAPIRTYTSAQSDLTALTKDIKGYVVGDHDAKVTINGFADSVLKAESSTAAVAAKIKAVSGNGTVVKVFANKFDEVTAISVVQSDLAVIDEVGGINGSVTMHVVSVKSAPNDIGTYVVKSTSPFYKTLSEMSAKDRVVITQVKGALTSVTPAKELTGKLLEINKPGADIGSNPNISIKVDDETYAIGRAQSTSVGDFAVNADDDATFWIDGYGYVVDYKAPGSKATIAYVLNKTEETLLNDTIVGKVDVVYTDGTTATLKVPKADIRTITRNRPHKVEATGDGLYKLTDLSTGGPTLITAGSPNTIASNDYAGCVILLKSNSSNAEIESTDRTLTLKSNSSNGTAFYENYYSSNVKFIYVKNNGDKSDLVGVYDGVQASTAGNQVASFAVLGKGANGKAEVVAVFLHDATIDNSVINLDTLAFIPTTGDAQTASVPDKDGKNVTVKLYNGMINGEAKQIKVFDSASQTTIQDTSRAAADGSYFILTPDDRVEGSYKATAFNSAGGQDTKADMGALAWGTGSVIKVNGNDYEAADAKVKDVRSADDQRNMPLYETLTGSNLLSCLNTYKDITVSVIYNDDTGKADLVYVMSVANKLIPVTIEQPEGGVASYNWNNSEYDTTHKNWVSSVAPAYAAGNLSVTVEGSNTDDHVMQFCFKAYDQNGNMIKFTTPGTNANYVNGTGQCNISGNNKTGTLVSENTLAGVTSIKIVVEKYVPAS